MKEPCDYWLDEREREIEEATKGQAFEDLDEAVSKLIDAINGFDEVGIKCDELDEADRLISKFSRRFQDVDDEPDYYHEQLQRRLDGEEF